MLKTLGEVLNNFISSNITTTKVQKLSFLEARLEELKDIDLS
jgi:hypothetical protein